MTAPPWMQTFSGVAFDLLAPRAEDVKIDDIATALSRIVRFNGHTREPYTVAQHSVHVSELLALWGAPFEIQRQGLLHDAPEAYYGDITSPVTRAIESIAIDHDMPRSPLAVLRERVDAAVHEALGLPPQLAPIVTRADLVILARERRDLMAPCERDWMLPEFADTRISIVAWRAYEIEGRFRKRLAEVTL